MSIASAGRVDQLDRARRRCSGTGCVGSRRRDRGARARRAASGCSWSASSVTRADGPSRYGVAVVAQRLEGVRPRRPGPPRTRRAQAPAAMSSPSLETIRPSFIGYSCGVAQARPAAARGSKDGARVEARPARRSPARSARASSSSARSAVELAARAAPARSRRRARSPGGSARPPSMRDDPVAEPLEAQAALDDLAVVARPARPRSGSRGSRARGAGRCAARGSRSTRRSRRGGAARRICRVDLDAEEPLEGVDGASSGRRQGRCRRCARRCR